MSAILGIDLGTTNSSCAVFDDREPIVIPNDRGLRVTPSVVAFSADGSYLVGESAKNRSLLDPALTVRAVKRRMGEEGDVLSVNGKGYSPVQISALILAKIKDDAERYLGEKADSAVITVPAYFSEKQRRATRDAGTLAGFNVLRIVNEPTASALAYALKTQGSASAASGRRVLVYDLGGGTFDVTVLEMTGSDCRVLSSRGDDRLGGLDFDALLMDAVRAEFGRRFDPAALELDRMLMQQLADQTERAKIELSGRDSALIAVPFASGPGNLEHFTFEIRREEFERMIRPLIERTVSLVLQALGESGLGSGGVDALVLAGGSSRIPLVRQMLSAAIGKAAEPRINPEEIVALGAAVEAAAVSGLLPNFRIRDVTSFSLGVEIEGDEFVPIIEKNAPLPLKRARYFTTIGDDQSSVEIHVLQGEEGKASRNHSLGRFLLSGIRPGKRGEPRIEVCFELDADDLLHVSARDADTGARQEISIAPERAAGAKGELAEKVLSLLGRVRDLKASVAVDRGFEREIEETLGLADIAARDGDEQLLKESRMALETIVGELLAETDKV